MVSPYLNGLAKISGEGEPSNVQERFLKHVMDDICVKPQDFSHLYTFGEDKFNLGDVVLAYSFLFRRAASQKTARKKLLETLNKVPCLESNPTLVGNVLDRFYKERLPDCQSVTSSTLERGRKDNFDWAMRLVVQTGTKAARVVVLHLFFTRNDGTRGEMEHALSDAESKKVYSDFSTVHQILESRALTIIVQKEKQKQGPKTSDDGTAMEEEGGEEEENVEEEEEEGPPAKRKAAAGKRRASAAGKRAKK